MLANTKKQKGDKPMRTNKNLLAVAAAVICCAAVVWFATSIHAGEKTYEVQPQITIPEYRTDAARAIDAYERLMDRLMDLTEMNLDRIDTNIRSIVKKLDSIDAELKKLSARIEGIENALGIEKPKPQTKPAHTKPHKKPSPQTAE